MTTDTQTQSGGMNQMLIWMTVAIVVLAVIYYFI